MSYAHRKADYNTGTQLNISNYNRLYPLIYFDLSYQTEKSDKRSKTVNILYRLSANAGQNFSVHAIVLHEETIAINQTGNELVIV